MNRHNTEPITVMGSWIKINIIENPHMHENAFMVVSPPTDGDWKRMTREEIARRIVICRGVK